MQRKSRPGLKLVTELTADDLHRSPVWEYVNDDRNELTVQPIRRLPVRSLSGRLVGSEVELACGERVLGLLGNIDAANPRLTEHFLTLSVERDGKWFHLARYHDIDAKRNGPAVLAQFLRRPISDVFPIRYDVTPVCVGDPAALKGQILRRPRERMSVNQLIAMAVRQSD